MNTLQKRFINNHYINPSQGTTHANVPKAVINNSLIYLLLQMGHNNKQHQPVAKPRKHVNWASYNKAGGFYR